MNQIVVAIVVTFNRKVLLIEALTQLMQQSYPLHKIILINNASTDGTEDFLKEQGWLDNPIMDYHLLPTNIGGAGGFNKGMSIAAQEKSDWVWIMDDDSIPEVNALEQLLLAQQRLVNKNLNPVILASRVNWTDGSPHPMNFPTLRKDNWQNLYTALAEGCLPLRATSFVSMLLTTQSIHQYGLPIEKYFIWNDDVEYSGRVLRCAQGYLVADSVVIHKTRDKYTPFSQSGDRFFYEVRNKVWMIKSSDAWTGTERIRYILILIKNIIDYLKVGGSKPNKVKIILRGLWHGFFKK